MNDLGRYSEELLTVRVRKDEKSGRIFWRDSVDSEGRRHSETGPCYERWDSVTGHLIEQQYQIRGHPYRENGPSLIEYDPQTGRKTYECWTRFGTVGREDDAPAKSTFDPKTGVVTNELYMYCGLEHRDNGPAVIHRDPSTGSITFQGWKDEGLFHRDGDLPAYIDFDPETGQATREEYWTHGKCHRISGPAVVLYDKSGTITSEGFFQHGAPSRNAEKMAWPELLFDQP